MAARAGSPHIRPSSRCLWWRWRGTVRSTPMSSGRACCGQRSRTWPGGPWERGWTGASLCTSRSTSKIPATCSRLRSMRPATIQRSWRAPTEARAGRSSAGRPTSRRASAAGHAHMPGDRGPGVAAVDDEVVPLGLARDRLAYGGDQRLIALALAQRRAQVGRVLLAQAHIEGAGAGEAHAVAGFAEIVRERCDEAEPPAGLAHAHITGGAASAIVDLLEGPALREPGPEQRQRQILVEPRLAAD